VSAQSGKPNASTLTPHNVATELDLRGSQGVKWYAARYAVPAVVALDGQVRTVLDPGWRPSGATR